MDPISPTGKPVGKAGIGLVISLVLASAAAIGWTFVHNAEQNPNWHITGELVVNVLWVSALAAIVSTIALAVVRFMRRAAAFVINPTIKSVNTWKADKERQYDRLPVLGKLRVAERTGKITRAAGFGLPVGVFAFMAVITSPLFAIPCAVVPAMWAYRNWVESSKATNEAKRERQRLSNR